MWGVNNNFTNYEHKCFFTNNASILYDQEVVIDAFKRALAGQWHTAVNLDLPGAETLELYLIRRLGLSKGHRLLDFGCGVGVTTCRLARRTGCQVNGLNISATQVGIASELGRRLGLEGRVRFDLYPGFELPYSDGSFESVIFFDSVCHVHHKELLFRELFRVLKPGGWLGGQDWMLTRDDLGAEDRECYVLPIEISTEVELRSVEGYRRLMLEAGFVDVEAIDLDDVTSSLSTAFPHEHKKPILASREESMAERFNKGDLGHSAAYQCGLFTVGMVIGRKPDSSESAWPRIQPSNRTRILTAAEMNLTVSSKRKNVAVIAAHRSRFPVSKSPEPTDAFMRLAARVAPCTVEVSVKVEVEQLHSGRYNLYYHGTRKSEFLHFALETFSEISRAEGISLDDGLLRRFLDPGVDDVALSKVVAGIDLRESRALSRLKLWFMIANSPGLVERAIELHGQRSEVDTLRFHEEFLVGFDMGFDGRSAIKLYPDVTRAELDDLKILGRLSSLVAPEALEAMRESSWTHLCLRNDSPGVLVHLHPVEPDEMVARYVPEAMRHRLHDAFAGTRLIDMVISAEAAELGTGQLKTFTLYYMPADLPRN